MTPPASSPRPLPGVGSPLAAALFAGGLVGLIWWAMVGTRRGQRLDALALEGSHIGAWRVDAQADQLLSTVSVPTVAAIIVAVLAIGMVRGRWVAALAAATAVAGANLTTQLLKYRIFQRDDLLDYGAWNGTNTLPSGHTTVAAAALVGLILVVPPTLRSLTAAVGTLAVSAYGLATLVNQWHRPSDVAAAILVSCAWGYLAVAVIRLAERTGRRRDAAHSPGAMSVILVALGICGVALTVAAGFLAWDGSPDAGDRTTALIAYAGGIAALAGTCCGGLGALLRLLDATRPLPHKRERVELGDVGATAPAPVKEQPSS
ncbi:MAG: phosphatase PAP2 family protein [Micropruina sp.]|uniref:phosphatase PAP2 family protein n=1 Tax=Micropruina sp. TaxID=2737536 RepID=UPI0039E27A8A